MNVTPENVLQARAVVLAEAEDLRRFVRDRFGDSVKVVGLCGGDPISREAQILFAQKIRESVIRPTMQYVERLEEIGDQLAATARAYGFTEQQITDSFRGLPERRA